MTKLHQMEILRHMNTPAISTNGVPELPLADRLLVARRRTGLSPAEFAKRTGISKATINNYERPDYERKRTDVYIKTWAIAAGVSYKWLRTGEVPGPSDDPGINGEREFACTHTPRPAGLATVTKLSRAA